MGGTLIVFNKIKLLCLESLLLKVKCLNWYPKQYTNNMQVAHSINMQVVHWVDTECSMDQVYFNFKKISRAN